MDITLLQRLLPASVKNALKPYYRTLFPNRLHVVFWITFRCNYRCSYCPVVTKFNFGDVFGHESERTARDWVEAFQKLPPAYIYLSGGEPFLYRELPEFINDLPDKHRILGIVTNGTAKASAYGRIRKKLHLNISFHREFIDADAFLHRLHELKTRFHLNVNIVATPENIPVIEEVARRFRKDAVTLHVDPYIDTAFRYTDEQLRAVKKYLTPDRAIYVENQLQYDDYEPKICSAGKNYINVMPNGDVYTCHGGVHFNHSPLFREIVERSPEAPYPVEKFRMGNLFDERFKLNDKPIVCSLPCTHPCDLDSTSIRRPKSPRKEIPVRA